MPLAACNVYISEGRNRLIIQQLETLGRSFNDALLANVFMDNPYNRSNFTIVSRSAEGLAAAAITLARSALSALDLRSHAATHPRLGVVDHISCHSLQGTLDDAAAGARLIGEALGSGSQAVPVYLYGKAHPHGLALDEIRRKLGYFSPTSNKTSQQWQGALVADASFPPSFGPAVWKEKAGVCCVGAVPWVVNFNVLLDSNDVAAAQQIARAVSGRNGGIPDVQAMALTHEQGVEIACNLLSHTIPTSAVLDRVSELAADKGMAVKHSYVIGKTRDQLIGLADKQLG